MWDNRARDDDARRPPQRHRRAAGGAGRGAREADRGSRQGSPGRGRTGGGQSQSLRRSGRDRPSTTADCKADAPALWPALGTHGAAARSVELALEELESSATEDEIAAERVVAKTINVVAFTRKRPARQPFPEHLRRERVVEPGPTVCLCCGSPRLRKLGEDVTETLEVIPRQWKVIQHVREKFTCRDCEKISQAPAPFHVLARGWAGPSLLAMILFEKYGQHQPLNRQSERYAREGVPLSLSTLADQVGGCCAVLAPLLRRVEAHVFAAERLHSDDTTVPVLAKGKTDTGRCWVYVRDDRPFGGQDPPAAMFYSRDRAGEHAQA